MNPLASLIADVETARERVLAAVDGLTNTQASWKPAPTEWSVAENLEHLVLAEQSGVEKIYRAMEASGAAIGENHNHGLPIEAIIDRTCRLRETAPAEATPRGTGTLAYWVARFRACSQVLSALAVELDGKDLTGIVAPHFLCGPLDAGQRLEFLRFHMDRHLRQIQAVNVRR